MKDFLNLEGLQDICCSDFRHRKGRYHLDNNILSRFACQEPFSCYNVIKFSQNLRAHYDFREILLDQLFDPIAFGLRI